MSKIGLTVGPDGPLQALAWRTLLWIEWLGKFRSNITMTVTVGLLSLGFFLVRTVLVRTFLHGAVHFD